MTYSFSSSNKEIRQRAAEIQKDNTWSMIGAIVITMIISWVVTAAITFVTSQFGLEMGNIGLLASISIAILTVIESVVTILLSLGYSWASLGSVDSGDFKMADIFLPFKRRPFRNFFVMFFVGLIVSIAIFIGIAAIMLISGFTLAGVFANGFDFNQLLPAISVSVIGVILLVIFTTWITLIYFATVYLPYDFNQLGVFKVLSISRRIMKGNKFKAFRLSFYYTLMMLLAYIVYGFVLFAAGMLTDATWVMIALTIVGLVILIVITIRLSLRVTLAQAIFYRAIITENEEKLANEIPELELDYVEEDDIAGVYHTEGRPSLNGDAAAVTPNKDISNSNADDTLNFVKGAGAATIFTAATSGDDEIKTGDATETVQAPLVSNDETETSESVTAAVDATGMSEDEAVDSAVWSEDIKHSDQDVIAETNSDSTIDPVQVADLSEEKATDRAVWHEDIEESKTNDISPSSLDESDDLTSKNEKKPYSIMGYNTPDRTDFRKIDNEKEVRKTIKAEENDEAVDPDFFNDDQN